MYSSRLLPRRTAVPAAVMVGLAAAESSSRSSPPSHQQQQRWRFPLGSMVGGGAALMEAGTGGEQQQEEPHPGHLNRRHPCTSHGRFIKGCKELKLFTGRGNAALAAEVGAELGVQPGKCIVSSFADGETQVQVQESVRGLDVYIFQRWVILSGCPFRRACRIYVCCMCRLISYLTNVHAPTNQQLQRPRQRPHHGAAAHGVHDAPGERQAGHGRDSFHGERFCVFKIFVHPPADNLLNPIVKTYHTNKQGYKHHRKVAAVSQDKTAMYLYSHDQDLAKMLEVGENTGRHARATATLCMCPTEQLFFD